MSSEMTRERRAAYSPSKKPCKRGHDSPRYSNGNCVQCLLDRERDKYSDPSYREAKKTREAVRYRAEPERAKRRDKAYRLRRREFIKARKAERYRRDYAENPGRFQSRNSARRAREKRQTPAWACPDRIEEIYAEAARLRAQGFDAAVDHIVPLRGMRDGVHVVCGLHTDSNLRVTTRVENSSKGCRWWPDM